MAILTLAEMKEQLSFTDDIGDIDDALLGRKINAAQNHIERMLGFLIEETFGGEDQEAIPPALVEAVGQLAAHWYEHREAASEATREIPFGVTELVNGYRDWTF